MATQREQIDELRSQLVAAIAQQATLEDRLAATERRVEWLTRAASGDPAATGALARLGGL